MKNILRAEFVVFSVVLFSITAVAQQPVPAPPKPATGGPTLAATMQLIQKEMNTVGRLSFVVHLYDQVEGNGASKYIEERSKVVADPVTCTIRYHWWKSIHGDVVNDEDVSFSFRDVLSIAMMSIDQAEKKQYEQEKAYPEEKQTLHMEFVPQMYVVIMRNAEDDVEGFGFIDKKQAERVAKAMSHAVELCGGKKDKF
jgi:hypothetical protein